MTEACKPTHQTNFFYRDDTYNVVYVVRIRTFYYYSQWFFEIIIIYFGHTWCFNFIGDDATDKVGWGGP